MLGENSVTGVTIRDVNTGETTELPADGLFVAIGHDPNTKLFVEQLELDDAGYIITKPAPPDERRGRLRGRGRRRPHVPTGGHGRRDGLHDGARRRALAHGP